MSLQDTVKADVAKGETAVKAEVATVAAKSVSVKVLVIVAVAAFVAGLLVHSL